MKLIRLNVFIAFHLFCRIARHHLVSNRLPKQQKIKCFLTHIIVVVVIIVVGVDNINRKGSRQDREGHKVEGIEIVSRAGGASVALTDVHHFVSIVYMIS